MTWKKTSWSPPPGNPIIFLSIQKILDCDSNQFHVKIENKVLVVLVVYVYCFLKYNYIHFSRCFTKPHNQNIEYCVLRKSRHFSLGLWKKKKKKSIWSQFTYSNQIKHKHLSFFFPLLMWKYSLSNSPSTV